MTVPVLTAVADPRWEAELVGDLQRGDHGVHVARRCVDLADLLAAAAAGVGRAVLLSGDLRRVDRDALTRLDVAGVAVVGVVDAADEPAERRLRQLGLQHVVPVDTPAPEVAAAVLSAVADRAARACAGAVTLDGQSWDWAEPAAALDLAPGDSGAADGGGPLELGAGRLFAVWGPTGAPGRTTVAVNVAAELAAAGRTVLLVDADVYGGVVAQLLGLLDEAPGVAAACRLANNGQLDVASLGAVATEVAPGLRVLSGLSRADRWPELRPSSLAAVLDVARSLADVTVVDCGFGLEQDEEIAYDTAAPRRNGATLAALEAADTVLGVVTADPVGLARYVRTLGELGDAVPDCSVVTVVNRLRKGPTGPGDPRAHVAAALERYAGVSDVRFVPQDVAALDAALAAGRSLAEAAPGSPARHALRELAHHLVGEPAQRPGRRRRQLRGRR